MLMPESTTHSLARQLATLLGSFRPSRRSHLRIAPQGRILPYWLACYALISFRRFTWPDSSGLKQELLLSIRSIASVKTGYSILEEKPMAV